MRVACARPRVFSLALAFLLAGTAAWSQTPAPRLFRISIENPEQHVQTRMVRLFADRLASYAPGALKIEMHSGASLFRDADVLSAMAQGKVEMAVPGIWQLDRYAPDMAAFMLPSVYGRSAEEIEALADGPLARMVVAQLEAAMQVSAIGRFIELGEIGLFGVKRQFRDAASIRGLKIRVAGGKANAERIAAMGAVPLSIPASDLQGYIEGNLVDGILTSFETVQSSGMDAWGIGSAYADREYFGFYVPLVDRDFWLSIDKATRLAIVSAWESVVPTARAAAKSAQAEAAIALAARGLKISRPSQRELDQTRGLLLAQEDAIAARLGISPGALTELRAALARR